MSTTILHRDAVVSGHEAMFERISDLFSRVFRAAAQAPVDTSNVWSLYRMTCGVDSVSSAVERRLAEQAAR